MDDKAVRDTRECYDELADFYDLLFDDWGVTIQVFGNYLHGLIQSRLGSQDARRLLDPTCGIGTQAIGLAGLGYDVTATDISLRSVERAAREAAKRSLIMDTRVANILHLARDIGGTYDVVISCDNALPHLTTQRELLEALRQCSACLAPGGLFIATLRDYDRLGDQRPRQTGVDYFRHGGERLVFQLWQWHTRKDIYDVTLMLLLREEGTTTWTLHQFTSTYRALRTTSLMRAMVKANFTNIECVYDPTQRNKVVVIGQKAGEK